MVFYFSSRVNFLLNASSEIPFVSGIIKITNNSWKTIIIANIIKTTHATIVEKNNSTKEGIMAAKTQCVDVPKD